MTEKEKTYSLYSAFVEDHREFGYQSLEDEPALEQESSRELRQSRLTVSTKKAIAWLRQHLSRPHLPRHG
jgi:hypothetical protein